MIAKLRAHPRASSVWLRVDPDLSGIARSFARALAIGWSSETIRRAFKAEVNYKLGDREWTTSTLLDPDKLDARALVADRPFDLIGVGVAQSSDRGPLAGRIYVVIFSGCQPRPRRSRHRPSSECNGPPKR